MQSRQLWYTRRGREIRGPFPPGLITRYILLGRIKETDELSIDQIDWMLVSDVPELIPKELKADPSDPVGLQNLKLARYREDERQAGDRRRHGRMIAQDNSRDKERRKSEPVEVVKHRALKTEIYKAGNKSQEKNAAGIRVVMLISLFILSVALGVHYLLPQNHIVIRCNAPPAQGVNWSNCQLDGLDFSEFDLSDAKLRNASFRSARMRHVTLRRGDLAYGNFSLAVINDSDLSHVILKGAVLRKADLSNTNLFNADLTFAILQGANLAHANLQNADLSNADLNGANLTEADLRGAKLANTIWIDNSVCAPQSVGVCIALNP